MTPAGRALLTRNENFNFFIELSFLSDGLKPVFILASDFNFFKKPLKVHVQPIDFQELIPLCSFLQAVTSFVRSNCIFDIPVKLVSPPSISLCSQKKIKFSILRAQFILIILIMICLFFLLVPIVFLDYSAPSGYG